MNFTSDFALDGREVYFLNKHSVKAKYVTTRYTNTYIDGIGNITNPTPSTSDATIYFPPNENTVPFDSKSFAITELDHDNDPCTPPKTVKEYEESTVKEAQFVARSIQLHALTTTTLKATTNIDTHLGEPETYEPFTLSLNYIYTNKPIQNDPDNLIINGWVTTYDDNFEVEVIGVQYQDSTSEDFQKHTYDDLRFYTQWSNGHTVTTALTYDAVTQHIEANLEDLGIDVVAENLTGDCLGWHYSATGITAMMRTDLNNIHHAPISSTLPAFVEIPFLYQTQNGEFTILNG
jgi:hypothetical protein